MSRLLIIGCGGVAQVAIRKCCQNSEVFTDIMIASRTLSKCDDLKAKLEGKTASRIETARVDADNVEELKTLIRSYRPDAVLNVALPYQDLTIMDACLACGVDYIDTANYECEDTQDPQWREIYEKRCKKLGFTAYFDYSWQWAYQEKFKEPMEWRAQYNFDQVGEKDMYLLHHEEIESLAKNIPGVKRIRFFMTFGQSYLTHMKCLEDVGMLRTDPIMVDGKEVVPLQVLKELLPDPASLGPRTVGKTNIGCIFNGIKDGKKKSIYIYNVCDHQECYKEVESQAVSYTTGVPAMIGSMMVVTGLWKKPGVFNLEEMDPDPYMEALNKFGLPWKVVENPVSVDCYKTADPSVHMD